MADDARSGPSRAQAVGFGLFLVLLAVTGVWSLVAGLQRSGSDGVVLAVLGGLMLSCVVAMGIAIALVQRRERRLSPEQRAAARSARYAEARARRPAWLDSPWAAALVLAAAAYWGWFAVAAAQRGSLWLAALDALLCLLALWTAVRILRRRRRSSPR